MKRDGMGMSSWFVLFVWRCFIHDLGIFPAINLVMGSRNRTKGMMMMIWSVDQMNRAGIDWEPIQRDVAGTGWIRDE